MLEWLRVLQEINRFYADVIIDREFNDKDWAENLIDSAVVADTKISQKLEGLTQAAFQVSAEDGMAHVLVTPKVADVEGLDALCGLMEATRRALPKSTEQMLAERDERDVERVHRDALPIVEFQDNHYLMGAGFPWLFMGFEFGVLRAQSSVLSKDFVEHAVGWSDGRFARCSIWSFVVFNQIQRHALTQQVAGMIKPSFNSPK